MHPESRDRTFERTQALTGDWQFEPVIGLEVHAQVLTRSKMFCGCDARYSGAAPNTHTCAVCLGMPGSLPVINRAAVAHALRTALALGCSVPGVSRFDRKNYSYPDIPKGYQISQYDMPLGVGGRLDFQSGGQAVTCGITRLHLEEDTGKSLHTVVDGRDVSLVDYNRSGVPLMEIVSEPELRSPEMAREYFAALRQLLVYLGVCDGNLQEGSMRADVNVSLRGPNGVAGTKVEIKNLNSFRAVQRALEYELERQREALRTGEGIVQETRGWLEREEVTVSQRTKEYAHDYRYFPEPDLPPLLVTPEQLSDLRSTMPELPGERTDRLRRQYELSAYTASVLTAEKELADYFEAAAAAGCVAPPTVAKWVTNELRGVLDEQHTGIGDARVSPAALSTLLTMLESGSISRATAKQVLAEVARSGEDPTALVEQRGLDRITSAAALEPILDQVLDENQRMVQQYRAGNVKTLQALVGQVMKRTDGRADPILTRTLLEQRLGSVAR